MHDCPLARCARNATLVEYAAAASGLYVDFFGEGQRARALSQLREFAFVGLVEHWGLSACLYHARLGGPPPITAELANVRPSNAKNALREQDTARLRAALQEHAPSRLVEDSEIYAAGAAKFWADVRSASPSPPKSAPPVRTARGDAGIRARAQSGGKRRAHGGARE